MTAQARAIKYFILFLCITSIILIKANNVSANYSTDSFKQQVIEKINLQRQNYGLPKLQKINQLDISASVKSQDLLGKNYWGHVSPQGVYPWRLMDEAGYYYTRAGENLGRGYFDANSLVSSWMVSNTHRENILSPKFRDFGISVADGNILGEQTRIVILHFGSR